MKTAAILLLSSAFFCSAQETKTTVKRLESVTWDLASHKLVWLVGKGNVVDGEFVLVTKVKYEVSPDDAFMAFAGEQRTFGQDEAVALHQLLDALSIYCVESVVWWDKSKMDTAPTELTKPERPPQKPPVVPDTRPVKVGELLKPAPRLMAFQYR